MVSLRRRCTPRTALITLLLWLLFAILFHLKAELWNPINGPDYFVEEDLEITDLANERQAPTVNTPTKRRTAVVVASQRTENATWLSTYFPDWEKNIYAVDDPTAELTVPKNKGRESMVYLTYADWTDYLLATRGDRAKAKSDSLSITTITCQTISSLSIPIDTSGITMTLTTMAFLCYDTSKFPI